MKFYSLPPSMDNESSNTPNSKHFFPFSPDLCSHILIFYFPIKDLVFNNQDSLLLSLTVHII